MRSYIMNITVSSGEALWFIFVTISFNMSKQITLWHFDILMTLIIYLLILTFCEYFHSNMKVEGQGRLLKKILCCIFAAMYFFNDSPYSAFHFS